VGSFDGETCRMNLTAGANGTQRKRYRMGGKWALVASRHSREGRGQVVGLEAERAGLAFVGDFSLPVDQIKAVGPSSVGLLGGVAELIKDGGKLYTEFPHAGSGNKRAFLLIPRTGENDLLFDVALHLPDVAGVRFGDVDDQEGDAALVLLVELVEGGSLPSEGGSGVAAEDEHDRVLLVQRRELDRSGMIHVEERKIGGGISDMKSSGSRLEPEGFEGEEQEHCRAGHFRHDPGEVLRRPVHGVPHKGSEGRVGDGDRRHAPEQGLLEARTQPEAKCLE
jgi:hypothetical protein